MRLDGGDALFYVCTLYRNEEEVASAIKKSGIPRKDIFITTKV